MIERTRARLEQARSWLRKLQAERIRQIQQATPTASAEFFSLLESFITDARSIRWVLQSEEKEKYDAWMSSPGAAVTPAEQEIFRLVTSMRNAIEKQGHPSIVARAEASRFRRNPAIGGSFGPSQWSGAYTQVDIYYVSGTDREVVHLCEQYIAILARQVDDFERWAASAGPLEKS